MSRSVKTEVKEILSFYGRVLVRGARDSMSWGGRWFVGTALLSVGLYLVSRILDREDELHQGDLLVVLAVLMLIVVVVMFVVACFRAPVQFDKEKDAQLRRQGQASVEALQRVTAMRRRYGSNIEPRPPEKAE